MSKQTHINNIIITTSTEKERMHINLTDKDVSKFIETFNYIDLIWDKYEKDIDFNTDLLFN